MIAAYPLEPPTPLQVTGVPRFQHLFRVAGGVDIDKSDFKRYTEFVNHKVHDLLLIGEATASANGRDIIEPHDLPITKGLQECIHAFGRMKEDAGVEPLLDRLIARPPLDRALSDETEARLPAIGGGLSVALARMFKIVDPHQKNPDSEHWERAFRLADLLL
ncbi:MAG TPA: DUF1931 family protein [Xanthobacteraceae bacterium]|jgi:hypothetical protein